MQLYGNLKVNLSGFPEEECILIPTSQSITYSEEIEDRTEKEDVKYQQKSVGEHQKSTLEPDSTPIRALKTQMLYTDSKIALGSGRRMAACLLLGTGGDEEQMILSQFKINSTG